MRIALTPGEPAGIGPDLTVMLAQQQHEVELVAVADPQLLAQRAEQLGLPLTLQTVDLNDPPRSNPKSTLSVYPVKLATSCQPGQLNRDNAPYVLASLELATQGCLNRHFNALVTAPVQKSIINDAGIPFSGHTEFLAAQTQADKVVMMLATQGLRVALVTTHLPLNQVAAQITADNLSRTLRILHHDLSTHFGLANPIITVLGLNPHAGENGHLGTEERDIITPCLNTLRDQGMQLIGPLPADTAFTEKQLQQCDAVLAMYHDQGLPVLKYKGFGRAVNITLGLPIIRTSVDHGTALDLAGSGNINPGSLQTALDYAITMATHRQGKT